VLLDLSAPFGRQLTGSTTKYLSSACSQLTAYTAQSYNGSGRAYSAEPSMFAAAQPDPPAVHLACGVPQGSVTVIGPILFILYTVDLVALIEGVPVTGSRHTSTPTTHRFTVLLHHHTSTCFYQKSPTALPPSLTGCSPTACNSTITIMWANAQRDGRRAEHRWRPLFNAAKFG